MSEKYEVKIISRSSTRLTCLEEIFSDTQEFVITRKLAVDDCPDLLGDGGEEGDALIIDLSDKWELELQTLAKYRRASDHVPMIIVGREGNMDMMRLAMKAGARDFYTHPAPVYELRDSVQQICEESRATVNRKTSGISVILNNKGGSGASLIASNISYILATERRKESTMLLDLDLQYGILPMYFDMKASGDLHQALDFIDSMDEMALQGYILKHESGVHLMASMIETSPAEWNANVTNVAKMIELLSKSYQQIVIDLPRYIDPIMTSVLERADTIFLVVQQGLADIHYAKQFFARLEFFSIPTEKVRVLVNRFETRNPVSYQDMQSSLPNVKIHCIPNDYKRVSESINHGIPLAERWQNAPITTSIREVAWDILGIPEKSAKPQIGRKLFKILGAG